MVTSKSVQLLPAVHCNLKECRGNGMMPYLTQSGLSPPGPPRVPCDSAGARASTARRWRLLPWPMMLPCHCWSCGRLCCRGHCDCSTSITARHARTLQGRHSLFSPTTSRGSCACAGGSSGLLQQVHVLKMCAVLLSLIDA